MKLDLSRKTLLASLKVTLISMIAAIVITYVVISLVGIRTENFDANLNIGLGIAVFVSLLVSFPVSNVVLQQARSLEIANEKLHNLIRYDQLTGLLSRSAFFDEVAQVHCIAQECDCSNAVFFMDLDHFKKINDLYGHAAGDEVLRVFGAVVKDQQQEGDLAGRLGGEEFALFIPDCSHDEAKRRADQLAKSFNEKLVDVGSAKIRNSVSIGLFVRLGTFDLDKMLSKADELLYIAKQSGRNRVVARSETRLAA